MLNSIDFLARPFLFAVLVVVLAFSGMTNQVQAGAGKPGHGHSDRHAQGHGGGSGHMDHHNMPGGMPGDAADVSRKILVVAKDTKFNIKSIQVRDGETVKFVVKNKGKLVHEFTIGASEMQKMHQTEMMKMMDEGKLMADKIAKDAGHSHPNSVILEPGEAKEIIWMFHKSTNVEFGCNIPGHYDMGMKGKFLISS